MHENRHQAQARSDNLQHNMLKLVKRPIREVNRERAAPRQPGQATSL